MRKVISILFAVILLASGASAQRSLCLDNHANAPKEPSFKQMQLKHHALIPSLCVSKSASDHVSTFPYTFGFDVDLDKWWTLGGDNEGHNWITYSALMDTIYDETGTGASVSHSGADVAVSMSYYPDSMEVRWGVFEVVYGHAVQADNYLVSPALQLPADTMQLSFFCSGFNPDNPDSLEVLLGTTVPASASDFNVVLMPLTAIDWAGDYHRFSFDLSDYAGQTVYVAFHHRGNDNYGLLLDDVRIGQAEPPAVVITGHSRARVGSSVTFGYEVLNDVFPTSVQWTFEGADLDSDTGSSATWYTVGNYTVSLIASNADGADTVLKPIEIYDCGFVQLPYTFDFGSNSDMGCWEYFDANHDGHTWQLFEDYGVLDFSYDMENDQPVSPDDWLYLADVPLPEDQNYELYWEAYPGNPAYPNEYYSVYVIDHDFHDIDSLQPLYSGILNPRGDLLSIDLTPFAGDTVTILFRHHNCTDNMALVLTGVMLRPLQVPEIEINGPQRVRFGQTAHFVANAGAAEVHWTFQNGNPATADTPEVDVVWNTPGTYQVECTASNASGSDSRTFFIEVFDCGTITELPFATDFEDGSLGCWNNVDGDGDGYIWQAQSSDFEGITGHANSLGFCGSASYLYGRGALHPDNWLVSPAIQLPAGSARLSWYAKGADPDYYAENYSVYVSTTGGSPADFTTLLCSKTAEADWHNSQADLSPYASQTIWVAFRHHDVSDMYYLLLDDIVVDSHSAVGIDDADNDAIIVRPNPAKDHLDIIGSGIHRVLIIDVSGRTLLNVDHGGRIDIASLPAGLYFVRVVSDAEVGIVRVVKR